LEYDNLIECLLVEVPQIKPYYEEEIMWLEEDLPHVIFGMHNQVTCGTERK